MTRAAFALLCLGAVCELAFLFAYQSAAAPRTSPRVVSAQEFRLTDAQGRVRALLACGKNGSPALTFENAAGNPRVRVGMDGQASGVTLYNARGKGQVYLTLQPDGSAGVALLDANGSLRAALHLNQQGSPVLSLHDVQGAPRALLEARPDGSPALLLNGSTQKGGAALLVSGSDEPAILFKDGAGKLLWSVPSNAPALPAGKTAQEGK